MVPHQGGGVALGKLILMFSIGGGIAMRKQAVVLRPGGISSMEYHLFLDLSRWRSISLEKITQTPKAARNEQVDFLLAVPERNALSWGLQMRGCMLIARDAS